MDQNRFVSGYRHHITSQFHGTPARSGGIRAAGIGFAVAMLLVGCSGPAVQHTYTKSTAVAAPERAVKIEVDQFTKQTTYSGPSAYSQTGTDGDIAGVFAILAATASVKNTAYGIVVSSIRVVPSSSGYLMLNSAIDVDSKVIPMEVFDRKVECKRNNFCTFSESATIPLDRKYLQDHVSSGMRMRLDGKRGNQVFEVPAADVALFLSKVPM